MTDSFGGKIEMEGYNGEKVIGVHFVKKIEGCVSLNSESQWCVLVNCQGFMLTMLYSH